MFEEFILKAFKSFQKQADSIIEKEMVAILRKFTVSCLSSYLIVYCLEFKWTLFYKTSRQIQYTSIQSRTLHNVQVTCAYTGHRVLQQNWCKSITKSQPYDMHICFFFYLDFTYGQSWAALTISQRPSLACYIVSLCFPLSSHHICPCFFFFFFFFFVWSPLVVLFCYE